MASVAPRPPMQHAFGLAEMGPGYREFALPPGLRSHLQCMWIRNAGPHDLYTRVVPDGCIDIIWSGEHDLMVAGPATRAIIAGSRPFGHVGARFRPGVAPSFLQVSADALLDRHVPLELIWPIETNELLERAGGMTMARVRLDLLQSFLASRLTEPAVTDEIARAAIDRLRRSATVSVADLGAALSLSERQVLRRFKTSVGYGPKMFLRVLRFQRALDFIRRPAPSVRFVDVAMRSGYADQAHMAREFVQLAGISPARLGQMHAR